MSDVTRPRRAPELRSPRRSLRRTLFGAAAALAAFGLVALLVARPWESEGRELGEFAGFTDATCEAFDLSYLESAFGSEYDPQQDETFSMNGEDDIFSLKCDFHTYGLDEVIVHVNGRDPDGGMALLQLFRQTAEADPDYRVSDLDGLGDAGYRSAYEDEGAEKIMYHFVQGRLEVSINSDVGPDPGDVEAVDALLTEIAEQALILFASET